MEGFTKTCRLGETKAGDLFVKICFSADRLSITGVVGPKRNGGATACGQLKLTEWPINSYANGWDASKVEKLAGIWDEWHLNDLQPGCEHQRAAAWGKKEITVLNRITGKEESKLSGWVYQKEHADGVLCKPCPTCGYKYGTTWLKKDVPEGVLVWLNGLPDADRAPAWV